MRKPKVLDPSDSSVQSAVERIMLEIIHDRNPSWQIVEWKSIAAELNLSLVWGKAKPDAAWQDSDGRFIIAECYARVDELKPGHRRKLAMDALKLLSVRNAVNDSLQLRCLLIVPEELEKQLRADNWLSEAIRQAAEVVTVRLSDGLLKQLRETVKLQGAGQARRVKTVLEKSND